MYIKQFYNKNQFIINNNNNIYFQSYESLIAKIDKKGELSLGKDWDYSKTTLKHLYLFLKDYENKLDADVFSEIFTRDKNFNNVASKKAFLQKLIDSKIIKKLKGN